jgi:hypothetical protein
MEQVAPEAALPIKPSLIDIHESMIQSSSDSKYLKQRKSSTINNHKDRLACHNILNKGIGSPTRSTKAGTTSNPGTLSQILSSNQTKERV